MLCKIIFTCIVFANKMNKIRNKNFDFKNQIGIKLNKSIPNFITYHLCSLAKFKIKFCNIYSFLFVC
jgi:hypothetical protein